jgi:Right handed beta helix region
VGDTERHLTLDVQISPTKNITKTFWQYGVYVNTSNTTIKNLAIRGAYIGIRIASAPNANASASNNIVNGCDIRHGLHRILMEGDRASAIIPHDNEISFNSFTLNMYGYASPGAYPTDTGNATHDLALKEWFYWFLKYIVGDSSTADVAIKMRFCGKNNLIHNNIFQYGANGVFTYLCDNTHIYSNVFQHLSDSGVLVSDSASDDPKDLHGTNPSGETVQGNMFTDVAQFIRYDRIDLALDGVAANFHLFLYNTGANGPNTGLIVQFHMQYTGKLPSDPPSTVGKFALRMTGNEFGSTFAVFRTSGYITDRGGIPAVTISGNSFLSPKTIDWGGGDQGAFWNSPTMVGSFVNNRVVDNMWISPWGQPKWYGIGNGIQPYPPLY